MAKIIDLTDKLSFDENPKIMVRDKEIEVNSDAPTILKVMAVMDDSESEITAMTKAAELLFTKESVKVIASLKLSFSDYVKLIETAVSLAIGSEESVEGE